MSKAAIAIDKWKLHIFERHLKKHGYDFTQSGGLTKDTMFLSVETINLEAFAIVVKAANDEAAKTGKH
jgi:hypothetical protein